MKIVISLGGSVIVPNQVDVIFLKKFKKIIDKIKKGNKIVVVTGGGSTSRKYMDALRKSNFKGLVGEIGFEITKINGMLVANFLNLKPPNSMADLKKMLKKNNVVVTGALEFGPEMTSDGTSADIAKAIKADYFINITNVKGLYNKNPKQFKNAKFIPEISFKDFNKIVNKIKFKAGQHFVLDQTAARIISKNKIKTIITKDIETLVNIVKKEKFKGTIIH